MLIFSTITPSQVLDNWNLTEAQLDSVMVVKGFHFANSSWQNGRYMKLYEGYAYIFSINFSTIGYSWNSSTTPEGKIESILLIHKIIGQSDYAIPQARDLFTMKFGVPECDDKTFTCTWKRGGKPSVIVYFHSGDMKVIILNPSLFKW